MCQGLIGTRNMTVIEMDKNYEVYTPVYLKIMIRCMSHIHQINFKIALTDPFYFSLSLTTLGS